MFERNTRTSFIRLAGFVASLVLILSSLGLNLSGHATASDAGGPILQGTVSLPTATQTLPGGPTLTPTRTPTLTPVLAEAIGDINLRSGPGLDFDIVGELTAGTRVPVVGRSINYPWLLVAWEQAPGGQAWVFEQLVIIHGDLTTVPIVQEPELPTVDPTQQAIQETATVLQQTPGAAETATADAFFIPTGVYTATPGGAGGAIPGALPTFTPVLSSGDQASIIQPPLVEPTRRRGPAPAVVIISLGLMGILTLGVGLLRRL
jgi:uncharacterized protein YraI